ncbi:cadherin-23 isoform X8 [Neophocaena asiaeorientalis asiaeorientalis]|uniref:Cadherin-23 n=3 Tax=Neophocaena asiaeorientalis asiaeorientalis TaxID=1706337 RepID=A0A341B141_NEOAA|nr:cadherin-23 isoform X8 [Neophocaena asiaeorientalis asiaeorientalis]
MRCHVASSCLVVWLSVLISGCCGQVNRLPFFINHFFETYLLISEDTPVGSSVTQLLARDMDNDPLVFGVSGEEASRIFAVEPDTGVVWLRQPLDRETKSEFVVEFSVSDHQGVITRKVNIQVGDVNDNAPTFHNQPYSVRIPEDTPVGTPIFIVNATDPDLGAGGSVLFSFQPPSQFFAIDSARGIVTVIQELDYETTQAYQLTVNATDQDKTRPLSTLANLAIIITDVQDMDPIFINLPYSTNVYEHSPLGTTVRVITAIDQDKGRPRGIGYTIISGNTNSIFALDYISGALTLNGVLDRENPLYSHGFILTVKGTELNDDRTPSDATVTTTFNILVIDINDNAPEFNSSEYSVAITELAQVGFALPLFIQVVDKDENLGLNSMFEVYLVGNNSHHFIISPTSVQGKADVRIRVAIPLDYETVDRYDFDLFANESVPDHVGYAKVKITLINENDNRPIFSQPLYNVSLYENVTVGTSVLTVLATDDDLGTFGEVNYFFSDNADRFSLDKDTGLIMLIARLDYELIQRFTLTVIARDGGGEETTGRVRINVLDVNDNVPTFQKDSYVGALRENEPSVTQLVRLRATDEDSPPNNQITYSIVNASAFGSYFDIRVYEGYAVISVNRPLDYEQIPNGLIYLTVMAKDAGNPPLNSTVPVTVEVFDENDNPPTFSKPAYFVSVVENIMAGATVLFLNATDLDRSREYGQESIIYSLEGSFQFRINARSGEITTTSLLDRETKSEYILIVRAVDGGVGHNQKTGIATVNITLLDINDNHPRWKDAPYYINLVEMTPPDSDVTTVVAIDPDLGENGTLVYSIQPPNKFYHISSSTGKIRTTHIMLDRENPDPHEAELMRKIIVSVTDCGTPPLSATSSATVFVNLLDLNDNDPTFQNLPFVAEVLEGTPAGVSVYQVVAIDLDEGLNGLVSYRMPVGMPRMDFLINSSSGVVVTTAELDRERIAEYQLRVVASDAGAPTKSSTSTLTIRVLDVNDETPTFYPATYNVSVSEDVPREFRVVWLNCTDNDVGLNAELSYFITGGNVDGKFSVGYRDAVVRTVVNLDRETTASYTLVLEAIDNGPVGKRRTGTATVFVTVLDVNDNRPIFLQSSYEASVPEDIPEGHSIVQLTATDADEGEFGRVWYRILHGNHGNNFWIHVSSGLLMRGPRPLDRERNSSHVLIVEAYNHDLGPMRSSVRVIVYVEDVNDEAPVFTQQQYSRLELRETAGIGTSVIVVRATDRDTGDGGLVKYRILSGAEGKFEIDESTGLIVTVDYLDYETKTSYLMNVSATDQAPPFNQGFCTVYITLLNELDEAVQFSNASYEVAILENLALGTEIVRVQAYSIDNLNQITYRFDAYTSAQAKALFKIDAITGVITVKGLVDREKNDFYTLTVVADDGGPKVDSTVKVYITVLDENDNSPRFDFTSDSAVSVPEDCPVGQRVAIVKARDPDAGSNGQVVFSLASGNIAGAFEIITTNDSIGEVFVARPLDREELDHYILKVVASDRGTPPRKKDHILQVTILDVNDNPPVIESPFGYNVSVNENVGGGTAVVQVRATDRDIGINSVLSYYITEGNEDMTFRMDRISGEIATRPAPPDRERQSFYHLVVTVEDEGTPTLSATTHVYVTIVDENDNAPTFQQPHYEILLDEGPDTINASLVTVQALDPDEGPNGTVTYAIVAGNIIDTFHIDRHTGVIYAAKELDYEISHGRYTLIVTATDQCPILSHRLTSTTTVLVNVNDINDNVPTFPRDYEGPFDVTEGQPGPRVWTFLAHDRDSGPNGQVEYSIVDGDPLGEFLISPVEGVLRVRKDVELDRETIAFYNLTICARDRGVPPLSSTMLVGIRVLDINDNDPVLLNLPMNITISENIPVSSFVTRILASDADSGCNALLTFNITAGNRERAFSINATTGIVTVNRPLDRERIPEYKLTISVKDNPENPRIARRDFDFLLIFLADENDNHPLFTESTYLAEVMENSPAGTPLTVLNGPILALDADLDVYAVVTYQLLGAQSGLFDIDNSTGVVTVRSGVTIDREAFSPAVLELLLLAEDIGLLNGTADLIVTILDDNDNWPTFSPAALTVHLLENCPPGFSVLQVTATDEDSGLNAELIYRIEAGAQDRFTIHPVTGVIRVGNVTIDREEQESYRLTVVATDRGTIPLSGTAIITILIDDINDSRPEFLNPIQTVSVLESAEPGTVIANVTAIDRDLNPKLEYHIISIVAKDDTDRLVPDQEDAFAVNINTGSVMVKSPLNRELVATYEVTLSVIDKASDLPELSVSVPNAKLTVNILDVNDNTPQFKPFGITYYTERILEGATPGTTLIAVAAVDPDKGLNGLITYSLLDLIPPGYVQLEDSSAGKVIANRTVDYEEVHWLNFTVRASDNGSPPRAAEIPVYLEIVDINDNNPIFDQLSYQGAIFEDVPVGTVILRVTATDADSGNFALIEYSLVDGEGKFAINPNTGDIYVLSSLDREEKAHYILTALAKDNPGDVASNRRENSVQVVIQVLDINDCRPQFSKPQFSTSVYENEPAGTSVITMMATDQDEGSNAELAYSLEGPGVEAFHVDMDSGLVTTKRPLKSYERFNLTVVATDGGQPPLWGTAMLLVEVIDVNDNRPVFVRPPNGTILHIKEEIPLRSNVYEVYATDEDEGLNGAVRYSFLKTTGNRDWEYFTIDPVSGLIQTAQRLDREKQAVYSLILVASDLGQPVPYETMQPLQVALEDIDDNEPLFVRPPKGSPQYQLMTVPEHSPRGTLVGNVTGAVDADEGPNAIVYYFIAAGDEEKNFQLQPDGRLLVLRDLDREREAVFSFIVKASSNRSWTPPRGHSPALDLATDLTLQEVRVVLEDINDQPPRFTKAEYTAGVATDAKMGSELIQVLALDADIGNNSLVFYSILAIHYFRAFANDSEDVGQVFTMGSVDGILRTFDLFMAYSPGYFVVDIVARDLAGHNDTAIIGIYILRDDQRVKIVINEIPDRVRGFEEEFIRLLSNITGAIVNADDVQFHVDTKGRVNFAQTELLIHVVNRETNRILDVDRVIQMIDENKEQLRNLFRNYNVLDVQPAISVQLPEDMSALQMATIVLALLLFLAAMLFILMNWYYRTVHKRKLKAIVAGSAGNRGFVDIMDMPNTNKYSFDGANPVWLDPFCRNLELAAQAEHEDDLPENLSEIADLWSSPTRTHGTFGREPAAVKPDDDRYLRAAIQEYDNIAKLGQIIREGPIKGSLLKVVLEDYLRLKKLFAQRMVQKASCHSSISELIQTELEEEPGERSPGQGSLHFCHKPPTELKGPDGIHVTHGSTGTLLATDLNSLPEDDQKGLGRSLETLTAAEASAFERNARTESAKSTPLHKLRDVIVESPLEITEL